MDNGFDLDADLFMRVRNAVGTEETRYYLTGVFVEPLDSGGAMIVATDGRALLVARDRSAIAPRRAVFEIELPAEPEPDHSDCDECCYSPGRRDFLSTRMTFSVDAGNSAVASFSSGRACWLKAVITDLDCADKYPDWRKLFTSLKAAEKRRGHQGYGIDPVLLARVSGEHKVAANSLGEGRPFEIHFDGISEIAGLIMPVDLTMLAESRGLLAELSAPQPDTVTEDGE